MVIDYNDIINHFDANLWRFSYLTNEEIVQILNIPIKFNNEIQKSTFNGEYLKEIAEYFWLIGIKYSNDYDYSCQSEALNILQKYYKGVKVRQYDTINLKEACIISGLGIRAKNTLIFNEDFRFDFHIVLLSIDAKIGNLPKRKKANFSLLSSCHDCNKCIQNCPVQAIQINNYTQKTWVDLYKCTNFCDFGNSPIIPSRKWTVLKDLYSFNTIYHIRDIHECVQAVGQHINEYSQGDNIPICRECSNLNYCHN